MKITKYNAICNLGSNIDEIYQNAIKGNAECFDEINNYIEGTTIRIGLIKTDVPEIENPAFNIRCNKLMLKTLDLLKKDISELKYSKDRIATIVATTNSGVEEFETSKTHCHSELGNPAKFLKEHLDLKGYYTTVSTACSSGIKAFSLARDLMRKNIADAAIVVCVDSLAKVPVFGFNSLEVLSDKPSIPFSKNRNGMNIAEASVIFILEKESKNGIEVMGIGENSDIFHATTPDPDAKESINAINMALTDAKLTSEDIDYINAHGTGTIPNDLMEANAIYKIFKNTVPVSSTKPLTGHCLGAAAGIETALCCKLLENFDGRMYPNIYDNEYDYTLPEINLVKKESKYNKCKICMCNSFGFGGTNAIMIMGKRDE